MKISYIFASRSRPEKFFEALDNITNLSHRKDYEIIAALDEDDATMNNQAARRRMSQYQNVKPFYSSSSGKINAINREIKNISTDTDIICCHSDDMFFIKKDYDQDIIQAFQDGFNGLVHFPDQVQQHQLCTYPIISKKYVDFFGYIYNPKYTSMYADKEQQDVAKRLGKYKFVDKKILEHRHHLWGFYKADEQAQKDELSEYEDKQKYLESKNLIIVTSLSPNHANWANQIAAIKSWGNVGRCFSINSLDEIIRLREIYSDIDFIPAKKTVQTLIGKPLITINEMIDLAIAKDKDLVIINSDIILNGFPEQFNEDGLTIFSRYDYEDNFLNSTMFMAGFDVFFIPNKFLKIFPPAMYALGAAWWDYWIICWAILNKIPVYYPHGKFAFHKWHNTQYLPDEWNRVGEYFRWEFELAKNLTIPEIATGTLQKIKAYLK